MKKMTQKEFDARLTAILKKADGDNEVIHGDVDDLLLKALKSFGIELTAYWKVRRAHEFWYA